MLNKDTQIQFLLFDGPSAKLDGLNIARGWQNLGYNVKWYFPRLLKGEMHAKPEYVFTVKPREDELLLKWKSQGAKLVYIFEDETLVPERRKMYDFVVASSFGWKRTAEQDFFGAPCYLVRDEQDYYTTKIHTPTVPNPATLRNNLRIVTAGHMVNLKQHFNILSILEQVYTNITLVSPDIDRDTFPTVNFEKWTPRFDYFDGNHDRLMTEQFLKYDVAVVTQYGWGDRNSSRLRTFIYAGLPVVAVDSENHRDLWLNGDSAKIFLVKEKRDWLEYLGVLEDHRVRQAIADYNYEKVKQYAGIEKAAMTFIKAVEQYENTH